MFSEIGKVIVALLAGEKMVPLENILGFQVQQPRVGFEVFLFPLALIGEHGYYSQLFVTDQFDDRPLPMIQGVSEVFKIHLRFPCVQGRVFKAPLVRQ